MTNASGTAAPMRFWPSCRLEYALKTPITVPLRFQGRDTVFPSTVSEMLFADPARSAEQIMTCEVIGGAFTALAREESNALHAKQP